MNSDKEKVLNMINEMLFIIEQNKKEMPEPDKFREGDYYEVDDWMTFRLNSLKELISPGEGFARQREDHLDRHDKFLEKVANLNPELLRKQATDLIDEMLAEAKRLDEIHKKKMIREMKGEKAIGDSWLIFHLNTLRSLVVCCFLADATGRDSILNDGNYEI